MNESSQRRRKNTILLLLINRLKVAVLFLFLLSLFSHSRVSLFLFTMLHTKNSVESRHGKPKKFGETGDSALSGGPHGGIRFLQKTKSKILFRFKKWRDIQPDTASRMI